jgi:membrane fusion protein (multidrug efflux system)
MKPRKKFIAVVLFLFVSLTIWYLSKVELKAQPPESRRNVGPAKIVVKVMLVKKEDFTLTLDYVGSLKAKDEASVFSKVTGKLVEYAINEGDHVQKGQAVASIDRDETGLKFELAKVDSPIAGIVGRILLDKGATIEPNKTALAIIVDMDQMTVQLNIPEQDIPYFKKGLKAILKVDAYPDLEFEGEIWRVAEIVDPQTRTLPIEISIPNKDHRLKSGMFARIKIIAAQLKDVLVLPQDAIVQELGEKFVFTVENGLANKKKVAIGKRDNGKLEVLDGIKEGETAIVFGQQGLKDGAAVVIDNNNKE